MTTIAHPSGNSQLLLRPRRMYPRAQLARFGSSSAPRRLPDEGLTRPTAIAASPNQRTVSRSALQITSEGFSHATSNDTSHFRATPSHTSGRRESHRRRALPTARSIYSPAHSGVTLPPGLRQSVPSLGRSVYNTALPHTVAGLASGTSLPQDDDFSIWTGDFTSDLHDNTSSSSWSLEESDSSSFQDLLQAQAQSLPPHRRNQDPPTIRLTAAHAEPQADASFRISTSPLAGHEHYHIAINSTLPSTQMTPYMASESVEAMQTPVSPVSAHNNSPHDTTMADPQLQLPRKRSHSVMSQQHDGEALANAIHSRAPSLQSPADVASPTGEFSPRGSRAFKRGDPPTNDNGKYICTYAEECFGQIFDRKCEWSKHMDKHDRPYRCPHPSCAKLQGFTYSGGLLRHEREVHGKHGGPKAQLMCPFSDCKRHSGKGFTRKENLNEHLRRVHQGKEAASLQDPLLEQNGTEVAPRAEEGETQATRVSTSVGEELAQLQPSLKRQRTTNAQDHANHSQPDDRDQVIEQLRADNAWYADRLRQLEAAAAMSAEKTQRLEETIALWAQQNGQSHTQHDPQQDYTEQPDEQQQFAPQHEEQSIGEQSIEDHQQLMQRQLTEHHLAEQQLADPQLAQQELSAEDTMEGDLKAALASVTAA